MKSTGVRWADVLRLRWRSLIGRRAAEADLDEELRFHFESLVERYTGAGMALEAARRRARIETGGADQIKEECRDARGVSFLENLVRDAGYALRSFRRSPGFAALAALTIALGIGVNTGLFTFVYGLLMRPLPVAEPASLYNVYVSTRGEGMRSSVGNMYFVSCAEFVYFERNATTAEVAGAARVQMSRQGDPRRVTAQLVSHKLLPMIGARPAAGRLFSAEETKHIGAEPVAVLSYDAWQDWFGGRLDAIGQAVVLNRKPFLVVGVLERGAHGPLMERADVWIPYTMQAVTRPGQAFINDPNTAWIQMFARQKGGASLEQVRAEMAILARNAIALHAPKRTAEAFVEPGAFMNQPNIRRKAGTLLALLFGAVGLVLVVACANVANMLLARGLARRREIATRLSIGASRGRIVQQLMTESLLIACAGGMVGIGIAVLLGRLVVSLAPVEFIRSIQVDLSPNWAILLFTAGVSMATGILFGLVPALQTVRFELTPNLRSEGLGSPSSRSRLRLKSSLIAVQAAVCLVLLTGAGLLLRGFQNALHTDAGMNARNVLIAEFDLRQQQYDAVQADRFMNTLRENVSTLPGVEAVSTSFVQPMFDECGTMVRPILQDGSPGPEQPVSCDEVGPDFFRTAEIGMLAGREFTRAEGSGDQHVAIVEEALAARLFARENPIGRRIRHGQRDLEIIGVAANVRPLNIDGSGQSRFYTPMHGLRNTEAKLLVRYAGSVRDVETAVRRAAASLDSNVNVLTRRIEDNVREALAPVRAATVVASMLGGFALLLACSGIYGVVAFAVSQRRREVGIRVALGADRGEVVRLMLWQGLKPVLLGSAAGLAGAAGGAQLIRSVLYGVSPMDPVAFASTTLLLAAVALAAAYVPARGALRVDPAVTLRHE